MLALTALSGQRYLGLIHGQGMLQVSSRMGHSIFLTGERHWMARTLTILFRRDPSRDRLDDKIQFEGYEPLWPDGRSVAVGLDAFCKHGIRLLGLGKHLAGRRERLIRLVCLPLSGPDNDLHRLPGHRVRRFFIERCGPVGRIHFLDETPTAVTFEIGRDEPRVLRWIGLPSLADGERLWFDLGASAAESPVNVFSGHGKLMPPDKKTG